MSFAKKLTVSSSNSKLTRNASERISISAWQKCNQLSQHCFPEFWLLPGVALENEGNLLFQRERHLGDDSAADVINTY